MNLIRLSKTIGSMISVLLMLGLANHVFANSSNKPKQVLIIKSYETSNYNQVEQYFRKTLGLTVNFTNCTMAALKAKEDIRHSCMKTRNADLIFTLGTQATVFVLEQVHDIPVVAGLIVRSDMLKGHENATGVYLEYGATRQLKWIQQVFKKSVRVGIIYNPVENQLRLEKYKQHAQKWGCRIESKAVYRPQELPSALKYMTNRVDVILGIQDKIVLNSKTARQILLFSFRNRIPFVAPSGNWVKAGALYALDWELDDIGEQCGQMALSILSGKSVKELPSEEPRKELLIFNLKTARHMKLDVPSVVFKNTEKFIED